MTASVPSSTRPGRFHAAVWRWHFLIGMLVMPFLFMLAGSGALMLLSKPLDNVLNQKLMTVAPGENPLPASVLLETVREAYPHATVKLYLPPQQPDQAARFSLQSGHGGGHGGHGAPSTVAHLNPYTGELLGSMDPADSVYAMVKQWHGTLYLGRIGELLIEMAAGLAVLMIVTGLYLAWPNKGWRALIPGRTLANRAAWRRWHLSLGWLIAVPLLFFLISGMAWTSIWGGKLVQPWGSLPGTRFELPETQPAPAIDHASMNEHGLHRVPWAVEQTPLPQGPSGPAPLNLDAVVKQVGEQGFEHFRVHFPQGERGVWTLSATTIAGDISNPLDERILHLNPANGEPLKEIRFADYPAMGKAMAASIPFHQGDLGGWNWWLNLLLVTLVMALVITGAIVWWKRQSRRAPPKAEPTSGRRVAVLMIVVGCAFPLSAAVLLVIILLDTLFSQRATTKQQEAN
ncbi:MAG: PepSY domain-containing protein [Pseudomonadota bacterium]|nr:PepSY domain-containing protein [Pseudomonadota bacterium]MEE3319811.1 PepSY domain-containing protein [Pseudomonadota bacterium]